MTQTKADDLKRDFPRELAARLAPLGEPDYRGKQLFAWMHRRLATDFRAMSDLPAALREALAARFTLTTLTVREAVAAADGATKYLFALADGATVETVYIPLAPRATVCVSTQVGCAFGCVFCASGRDGLTRNLTAAEIVDQVYRVQAAQGCRVSNVVFMGMGEPLANYEETVRAVRLLNHPDGLRIAQRRLTISTVGLAPGIERLADEGLQVNLAISLHAPTQAARERLVPIAKQFELERVMAAARHYVERTGRKVTFQYTVVPDSNDGEAEAVALAGLCRHLQCLVNVIPLNPTEGMPPGMALPPAALLARADAFAQRLRHLGVEAALRRSRGQEVGGACGQLRRAREAPG